LVSGFVTGSGAWGGPPVAFLLENGAEQLAPWFGQIATHRYKDDLLVTEAQPLVAYILSSSARAKLTDSGLLRLTQFVEQELDAKGAIHITKDSGLFEALRDERS
jgi:hypothetical protein